MEFEIEHALQRLARGTKGYFHLLLVRVFWTAFHLGRNTKIIPTKEDVNKCITDAAKEELELETKWYELEHSPDFNWNTFPEQQKAFWKKAYREAQREL